MDEKMDAVYRGASMQLKDRIEVYYTEEEEWFADVVQGLEVHWDEDEGEARVLAKILFDSPTEGCWAKAKGTTHAGTSQMKSGGARRAARAAGLAGRCHPYHHLPNVRLVRKGWPLGGRQRGRQQG